MDLTDPEEMIVYSTFFEDEINDVNRNEGCCSTLIVLLVLTVLLSVIIV